jgi:diguanylate cyclase (GGDEF)-like protein
MVRTAPPEKLAKEWLVRIIERTPLADLEDVAVGWISREGPAMIAEILSGISAGEQKANGGPVGGRAGELVQLRRAQDASTEVPRDIAALQAVIVAALGRETLRPEGGEFGRAVERLSQIFGEIQAAITDEIVRVRAGDARRDPLTDLPCAPELHEWIRVLAAGQQRYGHPFALLAIDIEGLKRINDAFGRKAGDKLLVAVAELLRSQVRASDRVFRSGGDEFCVLVPGRHASQTRPLGERLRGLVEASQIDARPHVTITIGLASCPTHGEEPQRLLEAAEQATYDAKASGDGIALAGEGTATLQDR